RRLRINRREIKQIYHKYKPKKRQLPPPEPFEPGEQFLDFVELLDPLAPALPVGGPYVRCIGLWEPLEPHVARVGVAHPSALVAPRLLGARSTRACWLRPPARRSGHAP